jgi:hypothetical protein
VGKTQKLVEKSRSSLIAIRLLMILVLSELLNVFYQNYDLYVGKEQELPASVLVAEAKREVDYDNADSYKGIVFDEETLGKLTKLFPEEEIRTEYDAVKVVEKYGDEMISELKKRMNQTDE